MNRTDARRTGKVNAVALLSAKGGIGLSTLAIDWANALAQQGHRTLLLELAGGDLSWLAGATPQAFADAAADQTATAEDAAITLAPNLDLIANGNNWAVHGPESTAQAEALLSALAQGPWTDWIVDTGNTPLAIAKPVLDACQTIAVVVTDDIACVSRTYALLRRVTERGYSERLSLIFNQLNDAGQAESLRNRLDHITRTFLGETWPLCGVVPHAAPERRAAAVAMWVAGHSEPDHKVQTEISQSIINPAIVADNNG